MNYRLVIKPRTTNPKPKPAKQLYDYSRELKELGRLVRKAA
jgi:hypothetical protein